jgi:2-polyprenyl-3-methyl-5-hydroxy-6-metoxy-1,4-benzoquinol methylase
MKIKLEDNTAATFSKVILTGSRNAVWGISDCGEYHIKANIKPGKKLNTLQEEAEILKYLNERNCQTCVKIYLSSEIDGDELRSIYQKQPLSPVELPKSPKFPIMVTEALAHSTVIYVPDLLLAIIEQKKLGVWNGDLSSDDIMYDNETGVTKLIDYDQAVMLDKATVNMPNVDYLKWLNKDSKDRFGTFGQFTFYHNINLDWDEHIGPLFTNNSFKIDAAHIFNNQISGQNRPKIKYPFSSQDIFAHGNSEQDERLRLLEAIEFQQGENILDIGCNVGLIGHYLNSRGCHVQCIDIDSGIVSGAQIISNISNVSGIKFTCQDVDTIETIEDFDTICLFDISQLTLNDEQTALRISGACKRIIIECNLNEKETKIINGTVKDSTAWNFETLEALISFLEESFPRFQFSCDHGNTGHKNHLLEFSKNRH